MISRVPFFDLTRQNASLRNEIDQAIAKVINNTSFILGDDVASFEEQFASFIGTKFAVGVNSGLDALAFSLRAVGVGPGDEVIVPGNSFIATALAVDACGARSVMVDCDRNTFLMDLNWLVDSISPRTKAVVPVHLYGHPLDLSPVRGILEKRGIKIVEDACQAHGARQGGVSCGAIGDAGCFSFYPSKNLGAFGDGGMVTTDSEEIWKKIKLMRSYGSVVKYQHEVVGWNSRLDTIQAAILKCKLPHLESWNNRRREIAAKYSRLLGDLKEIELPIELENARHVYHLYIIRSNNRDMFKNELEKHGVSTGIHYPIPIHQQPAYSGKDDFKPLPVCEVESSRILSLPMFPEMTDEEVDYVAKTIRNIALNTDLL
ncbi:MAG: DegT/DnrJ/EryC1/StrS family aminotransferase [Pirellula sp.]